MVNEFYTRIYEIVRKIPKGKVATYGQVALLAGKPHGARAVGWALNVLQDDDVPWQRVINADGRSSFPSETKRALQIALLRSEGVLVRFDGSVDLEEFRWDGKM